MPTIKEMGMGEAPNKPVADVVHGCMLGMDKQGRFVVAKFDLGNTTKTMWIPAKTANFILRESPVLERQNPKYTFPAIEPDDWDGAKTPTITHFELIEAEDGMIFIPKLNRGTTDGLIFRLDAWSIFIKHLWQYQKYLRPDQ
jgi:hypothetical protein